MIFCWLLLNFSRFPCKWSTSRERERNGQKSLDSLLSCTSLPHSLLTELSLASQTPDKSVYYSVGHSGYFISLTVKTIEWLSFSFLETFIYLNWRLAKGLSSIIVIRLTIIGSYNVINDQGLLNLSIAVPMPSCTELLSTAFQNKYLWIPGRH